MKGKIYITGSLICSECGRFLIPEIVRNEKNVPTGEIWVKGHAIECSLFGNVSTVELPALAIVQSIPEAALT
jgi:hypothetical protein